MKKLAVSKATASLADYVENLGRRECLILTVRGKPVAALVPVEGVDMECLCLGTDPDFLDLIQRSRRGHEQQRGISNAEKMRRGFEVDLQEYRPEASGNQKAKNGARRPKTRKSQR